MADLWETFLMFCSWLRFPVQADLDTQSEHLAQFKLTNAMLKPVMPRDAWEATRLAIQGLRAFLESGAPGRDTPKGLTLFDAVATEKPDRLIVGSSKDVTALKEWAAELLLDAKIEVAGAGEIIPAQRQRCLLQRRPATMVTCLQSLQYLKSQPKRWAQESGFRHERAQS